VEKNGFVPVGKIVGAHGVKGNIKVYSYAESLSVFKPGSLILLINPKGLEKSYKIKWVKPSVFTTHDEYLGVVESIIPTGSNDVFVIRDPNKVHDNETLIPAIGSVILEIDLKRKTMRVDLPEGL
jgi:16S rRNA processing protein RimM